MAIRKNADGTVTVGVIPTARKEEAPVVADKPEQKKSTRKSTKK